MENPSHSLSRKVHNANTFASKPILTNVFGAPARFGASAISPRVEDYAEIFGGFRANRASSIPILDLPAVEESEVWFDVRSFDYSQVFGGFDGLDFAGSYDEVFGKSDGGDDSSEEAWSAAESGSLSDESEPSILAELNQSSLNEEYHESSVESKQFNISYNKANQRNKEDLTSGMMHVAQLHAVSGFSYVVNRTSQKIVDEIPPLQILDDLDLSMNFSGGIKEGNRFRKTMSQPSNSTSSIQAFGGDSKLPKTYKKTNSSPNEAFITISDISLKTRPSHLPPPSRAPPALSMKEGESDGQNSKLTASRSESFEGKAGDVSPPFFDVEVDASTSTVASAVAIKDAMNRAQAKLKSAKEFKERKKDGLQNCLKLDLRNDPKGEKENPSKVFDKLNSFEVVRVHGTCDIKFSEIEAFSGEEKQKVTKTSQVVSGFTEGEVNDNLDNTYVKEKHGKEFMSSVASNRSKRTAAWREGTQFYEVVETDKPKINFEQLKVEKIFVQNRQSRGQGQEKTAATGELQKEDNRKTKAAKDAHRWEGSVNKSEVAPGTCKSDENKGMSEATTRVCWKGQQENKLGVAEEVCEWGQNEKKPRVIQLQGDIEMILNEADICEKEENLTEVQLKENEREVAQLLREANGRTENEKTVQKENERRHKETLEREKHEKGLGEAIEQAESERRLKEALEKEEKSQQQKEAREREEHLKRQKKALERKENEKRLKEAFEREENEKRLKEALEQEENQKRLKEAFVQEEIEKRLKEALEREENEKRLKEALEREENEKKLKEALEREENEKRLKEALEREENEKRLKEALDREENEKRLKEALEQEENEKRLNEALEREENEKRLKKALEREENEKRLKEALEREENEKRLKKALEREENEKRLKEALEREENEKRLKEALEREDNKKRLKEALEQEENLKRLKEVLEQEENEKRLKEAFEQEENEKRLNEVLEREENVKRLKEALKREETKKGLSFSFERKEIEEKQKVVSGRELHEEKPEGDLKQEENQTELKEDLEMEKNGREKRLEEAWEQQENKKFSHEAHERDGSENRLKKAFKLEDIDKRSEEAYSKNGGKQDELKGRSIDCEQTERQKDESTKLDQETCGHEVGNSKGSDGSCKLESSRKVHATQVHHEHDKSSGALRVTEEALSVEGDRIVSMEPEDCEKELETIGLEDELVEGFNSCGMVADSLRAYKGVTNSGEADIGIGQGHTEGKKAASGMVSDPECLNKLTHEQVQRGTHIKEDQTVFDHQESKDKLFSWQVVKEWVEINGREMATAQPTVLEGKRTAQKVSTYQKEERTEKNLSETLAPEEREKEERRKREIELEKDRLRKIEEEREREREREKDRMSVERATREVRDRTFSEEREKAERAAVERATAEVRQRAMTEARERLEKACAEAKERSLSDKASMEARLRAERAAVERATAEARERAFEKAMSEKAASEARARVERSVAAKFYGSSRDDVMRQCSSSSNMQDLQFQRAGLSNGSRYLYSSVHCGVEVETAQRCKARLERHQRTAERAAKALAEKNMRDLLAQREQAEKNRLAELIDAEVKRWSSGKEGNLRALLSTLQYILGPDSGWQPIPLTEVLTTIAVKKAYRKATLCVHPDKLQQRGASIQQKYICEKVFDLLKEAWNKFNSEER